MDEKELGPPTYSALSRQPSWRVKLVVPESMARHGEAHGPPRQRWSNMLASVSPLVAPAHVARQSRTVATKGAMRFNNFFWNG
jgi:hypothetical protein